MWHRGLLALVVTAMAVSAGCQPPPPLPPGEARPMIESTVVEPVPVVAGQAFRLTVTARDDGPPEALEFALNGGFSGPWVGGFWGPDWKRITPAETQCGEVVVEVIGPDRSEAAITCSLPVDTIAGAWRTTVSVRDGVPDSVWSEVVEFRVQGAASQ